MKGYGGRFLLALLLMLAAATPLRAAESLNQLIAGAKKEPEITFIAGAQTFGGPRALSEMEAAFNKKFGLKARIEFAAGPEMNAMAAKEGQAILKKHEFRSSHLVEGTIMAKYLRENCIRVQGPKDSIAYYLGSETAEGLKLKEELAKILKQ